MKSIHKRKPSYKKIKKRERVIQATNFSVLYKLESIELCTATKSKIYTVYCKYGNQISRHLLTAQELIEQVAIVTQLKKSIIMDLIVEIQA